MSSRHRTPESVTAQAISIVDYEVDILLNRTTPAPQFRADIRPPQEPKAQLDELFWRTFSDQQPLGPISVHYLTDSTAVHAFLDIHADETEMARTQPAENLAHTIGSLISRTLAGAQPERVAITWSEIVGDK